MFQPFGLRKLFGVPTNLITEHAVEGHALLGSSISWLHATLGEILTFTGRVRLLDEFLLARLSSREVSIDSHWERSLALLAQDRGTHTIEEVAAKLNTSVRQLERKCLEFSGMTPQTMVRVARFLHALRLKRASNRKHSTTWTEIAHASGCYDQTHLIRDFYLMGGAKPSTLADQLESHHGASLLLQPTADHSRLSGDS